MAANERTIEITFEHVGTQQDFDNFILAIIAGYIEKRRLIEGERPTIGKMFKGEELTLL